MEGKGIADFYGGYETHEVWNIRQVRRKSRQ